MTNWTRTVVAFACCFACLGIMCVPAELKDAVRVTAKYQSRYVEYANKKIQENPDESSEEMVGVGERLERNIGKLNEYFNGK